MPIPNALLPVVPNPPSWCAKIAAGGLIFPVTPYQINRDLMQLELSKNSETLQAGRITV